MKVFKMRLVMGREAQYNKDGKLKNKVITPDYHDEMELSNILEDQNWLKLGACEISCISVIDTKKLDKDDNFILDNKRKDEINAQIQEVINAKKKPKTALQIATEANEALLKRIEALEKDNGKNNKSDYRKKLEDKADGMKIEYRTDIGDAKLLEKIKEVDKNFK